ncbi:helix-turn-helix domain-containing protein [Salidesulfovibrio brasiliensis]|uniref:helix-turn-helix domain-containing protein n=1 Tax=Salidesulfovibrio brasiliensis TaxID=221711 RepID=UPI001FE23216|nr:helix-turn-helix domain-containing protein [Salidesulfovibrio brasiliensis]
MSHDWPGNVRELKSLSERFVLSGLPAEQRIPKLLSGKVIDCGESSVSLRDQVSLFERHLIQKSIDRHDGNIKCVMDDLQIPRRTLNEKMAKYGLSRS